MSITALTDEQREKRRKQWDSLLKKYEKRGQLNTADCYFSEVNHKLFAKSFIEKKHKRKKKKSKNANVKYTTCDIYHKNDVNHISEGDVLKKIDINQIIDEDNVDICRENLTTLYTFEESFSCKTEITDSGLVQSCGDEEILKDTSSDDNFIKILGKSRNISTKSYKTGTVQCKVENNFFALKKYIEIELSSNLKEAITNKSISKLLEIGDCDYWHNCIKEEMQRLYKYVPRPVLKEYMAYCYKGGVPRCVNANKLKDLVTHKMNSNLEQLFIKRELMRHKKNKYLKYCKLIQMEWQRLCNEVPVDYLLVYGYSILHSIEKLEGRKMNNIESS